MPHPVTASSLAFAPGAAGELPRRGYANTQRRARPRRARAVPLGPTTVRLRFLLPAARLGSPAPDKALCFLPFALSGDERKVNLGGRSERMKLKPQRALPSDGWHVSEVKQEQDSGVCIVNFPGALLRFPGSATPEGVFLLLNLESVV